MVGLLCGIVVIASQGAQEPNPYGFLHVPSIRFLERKVQELKATGLLVGYPDGLPHTPFSRWEAAMAAHALVQHTWNLLGLNDQERPVSEEVRMHRAQAAKDVAEHFSDIEILVRATQRELDVLGVDLKLIHSQLDAIAGSVRARGWGVDRFDEKRFPDVKKGHWAENAVEVLRRAGIVWGYPDGRFRGG